MKTATNAITSFDIESANISLKFGCDALSAIANAIEVLSSIQPPPDRLRSNTIARLASHAAYLADDLNNEIGCFTEKVEASA